MPDGYLAELQAEREVWFVRCELAIVEWENIQHTMNAFSTLTNREYHGFRRDLRKTKRKAERYRRKMVKYDQRIQRYQRRIAEERAAKADHESYPA